jgi:hypothetical protein
MGEIVGVISGRDVKTWRKTGEWYVPVHISRGEKG